MKSMKVKEIELSKGRAKIAAVVNGRTHDEIIEQVKKAKKLPCDIIEWRADYFFGAMEKLEHKIESTTAHVEMIKILDEIDYITRSMPLMFTLRSKGAGGKTQICRQDAYDLATLAAQSKLIDFVNIEFISDEGTLDMEEMLEYVDEIHGYGIRVIHSHHEFDKALTFDETINLANNMRNMGADIVKIACHVETTEEAKSLLKAAVVLTADDNNPVIITGMGKAGIVTRIAGGRFGSCITFAYIDEPTAEGQLDVKTMAEELDKH